MTLSTLSVLGVTATIVILKLALFAFIVALAAKTLMPGYRFTKNNAVLTKALLPAYGKKRLTKK